MAAAHQTFQQRARARSFPRSALALSVTMLACLAACGGGGGSDSVAGETPEQPAAVVPVKIDAVPTGTKAFHVSIDSKWADLTQVEGVTGGKAQLAWNMADPQKTMTPGMKVAFFGRSPDCGAADITDGPVTSGADDEFALISGRTGISTTATTLNTRWTPSGATTSCAAAGQSRTGPHWIYVNPASGGGMAVYTSVGPDSTGRQPFLMATPATGTDGNGYNANGIATFVAFRHDWYSDNAVRPWLDSQGALVEARLVARQSVGAMEVGSASTGVTSQVKQQVMFTVINTTCQKLNVSGAGCHVQYLFNTAAARAGISDWEAFSPSQSAHLWFDKDQGALPVIDGQVPGAGKAALEDGSKLSMYRSAGVATQHTTFSNQPFDIRISFSELMNGVRLIAGRALGIDAAAVTDANLAKVWGPDWNNPDKWTLISTTFGQEIHNSEFETRRAWIGGGFSEIYAGPVK